MFSDWIQLYNVAKLEGEKQLLYSMEQKGMTFDHDFYVVVGKQCRTENAYAGHQHNIFI